MPASFGLVPPQTQLNSCKEHSPLEVSYGRPATCVSPVYVAVYFNRWRHCSRSRGFHAGDGSVAAAGGFAAAGDFAVAGDFSVADGMHLAAGGRGGRLSKTLWGVRTLGLRMSVPSSRI